MMNSIGTGRILRNELIVELIIAVILLAGTGVGNLMLPKITVQRDYWPDQHFLDQEYRDKELVEPWLAIVFIGITLVAILAVEMSLRKPIRTAIRTTLLFCASCICSFSICFFVITFLKLSVARLRPDWLSRCDSDWTTKTCRNPDLDVVYEGHLSFPSAHTGYHFWGASSASFYLYDIFRHVSNPHHTVSKVLIILAPLIPAVFTGLSRTLDNRHHPSDVAVGAAIGIIFGYVNQHFFKVYLSHYRDEKPVQWSVKGSYAADMDEANKAEYVYQ